MATVVALSQNAAGEPVLRAEVTRVDMQGEDYDIRASELSLPGSPADITCDWLPGVSPAAKEVAWQILDVIRQAGHWGMVTVTEMSMHMLADARRPAGERIGFRHHPVIGNHSHEILTIFRNASRELMDRGYVIRDIGNTSLTPTPDLVHAVTG